MPNEVRESLPDALAEVFEEVALAAADGFSAAATPGGSYHPGIRTADDWSQLLSAISSAGLLPQPELLAASRDLALPANLQQFSRRLQAAHEPPRADAIDGLLDGAVNRVRHLHGLLAEWELGTLSAEQTARLLAMLEALRARLSASVEQLRLWHDGIHASLGPERCQSLFWDLIDPICSERQSAHTFQREQMGAIEKRCAKLKVKSALLPSDRVVAGGSCAAALSSASSLGGVGNAGGAGGGPNSAVAAALAGQIDVVIGTVAEHNGLKVRVVRCPHSGVSWEDSARLLAWMDATKQLALSRHAPAYLGHEPCVAADVAGFPAHARWHLELVQGAPLSEGLLEGGALPESSLLFRHWRRELLEGLCHLSMHTTFLLPHAVTLGHAFAADEGCRIVFDNLAWGAEFPQRDFASQPSALQQALDTPSVLAAATGVAAACAESASASAVDISDGTAATQAGAADPIAVSSTAMPPSSKLQDVDHQALRDTLLLYDGVAMLVSLLTGKPAPTGAASHSTRKEAGKSDAAAALRAEAAQCSQYLSAILDACAHATSPPTLRQLLSHPYFAPVEGFEQEDVRAAYRRWRKQGSTLDKIHASIFSGTALG